MQQSKQRKSRFLVWPALAAAIAVGGIASQVQAEGSSSKAEVQRGVPGVDVDVNANRSKGVDVDLQAGNRNDSDNGPGREKPDTGTLGAGSDAGTSTTGASGSGSMRAPIQDRN